LVVRRPDLSANAILRELRGAGLPIRRQLGLDLVRQLRGNQVKANRIKNVRKDRLPTERVIGRAPTPTVQDFSARIRVVGIDTATGERRERFVTVGSSRNRTIGELETIASRIVEAEPDRYGLRQITAELQDLRV